MMCEPQRVSCELFFADGATAGADLFVRAFHEFIQQDSLDDMLIDVHDYSHVLGGPGIMLISYEGFVCVVDPWRHDSPGKFVGRALRYFRKRGLTGDLGSRVRQTVLQALRTALALEGLQDLGVALDTSRLRIAFEDRLVLPNTKESFNAVKAATEAVVTSAWGVNVDAVHVEGESEPLTVELRLSSHVQLREIIERLEKSRPS